ncbi:DNA repair exonuclease [Persephonella atlantica]|uniref:DNA repair exonuclease n=1 Tax=Persephonella atlantica TaxID=2699429 RepID=A0ABS1GFD3_9AQUI|nr:DNA repair exonuclease [Persephonella atlantica]MBK3331635.1 DNA repair exonuclease [Persephonella atlantica]
MRFVHISDTHLGYHQYGLKERAEDFFDVFLEAVEFAISKKVDFVLHTGDFFHSSRPSNHIILQGMEIVEKLKNANIPLFVISGNHDRGSHIRDVSPLRVLQPVGLKLIDKGVVEHEGVFIGGLKYISKAGLRRISLREILEQYLEKMKNGFKILMLHQEFQPFFPDSALYSDREIPEGFDYVGIGHYHIAQVPFSVNGSTVVYPGSTEFTAYNEKEEEKGKGFYFVNVDKGDIRAEFIKLSRVRPFIYVDFNEEDIDGTLKEIKESLDKIEKDKKPVLVLRGKIRNLSIADVYKIIESEGIDREKILHVQLNLTKEIKDITDSIRVVSISDEYIKEEIKKLIDDPQLSSHLIEIIQHLKSIDNIDEVKKILKENPEILEM